MRVLMYGMKLRDSSEYPHIVKLVQSLLAEQIEIYWYSPYAAEVIQAGLVAPDVLTVDDNQDLNNKAIDMVITPGGDGTILAAVSFVRDSGIPILGINLGRLGFLSSVEKKYIEKAVKMIRAGRYNIDSRTILGLKSNIPVFSEFPYALNDFTLNKRDTSSMITVSVYVDGTLMNAYWSDGIIISTPTGSTGYALSCGGPIIFPQSNTLIITPIAPHNLNVRPVVLSDNHIIKVRVEGRTDNFMCTMDSRYETITSNHQIEISKADFKINLVRLEGQSFMKTISEKLMWGIDKRN
jgi:NAD+ kinase